MGALQDRLSEVEKAGADAQKVDEARRKLVDELQGDDDAKAAVAEHAYRLGITTLMRAKDLNTASDLFKLSAEKKDPDWSPLARTSYALTLHAKAKFPQAVFEVRKVIGAGAPTAASATALCMLTMMLRDSGAKPSEIEKADKERIAALQILVDQHKDKSAEAAHWRVLLAVAHKEGGSRGECKKLLQSVIAMGKDAGEEALGQAKEFLKGM